MYNDLRKDTSEIILRQVFLSQGIGKPSGSLQEYQSLEMENECQICQMLRVIIQWVTSDVLLRF